MPQQKGFQFITCEQEAFCEQSNDRLTLQPLSTTRICLQLDCKTGDMTTPGVGFTYYNTKKQRWSGGGVITYKQAVALQEFLEKYFHSVN